MKKLAIVLSALIFAACATVGGGAGVSLADLQGKTFTLESFNGNAVNYDAKQPFIEFRENMASGQICNSFRGNPSLENGQIRMLAMSTMMMCVSADLNKAESTFYKMLSDGADVVLDAGKLSFKNGGNTLIFVQK